MRKQLIEQRWPWLVAAGVLVVVVLFEIRLPGDWDRRPRGSVEDIEQLRDRSDLNVLFILVDTLRAEHLGCYGYARDTSPVLDRLANSGVRFGRHLAQSSWTKASMASLWTGLHPVRTGVTRWEQAVSEDAHMPAEILRDAGFRTFAIWRNGWIRPAFGFAQGFEVYHSPRAGPIAASVRREKPTVGVAGTDQDLVRSAMEFLRTHGQERWFLYLHLMDVHQYVYDEETALFGTTYSDLYDNSIRWVDRVLGSLIREIDARGLRRTGWPGACTNPARRTAPRA